MLAANIAVGFYCHRLKKSIDLRLKYFLEYTEDLDKKINILGKVVKTYEETLQVMQKRKEDIENRVRLRR
jgi:citrate synthase